MKVKDLFWVALLSFFSNKVASVLIIVVIAIATGVSVTLVSQTQGLISTVEQDVLYLGPNTVLVENSGNVNVINGHEIQLNSTLVSYFSKIPHVKEVYPVVCTTGTIDLSGYKRNITIVGISNYSILGDYNVVYGKLATSANAGIMLPYALFKSFDLVGKEAELNISGHIIKLRVTGIINYSTRQLLDFTISSKDVVIPLSILQDSLGISQYKLVVIKVDNPVYDNFVTSYIKTFLGPTVIVQGVGFHGISVAIYYSNLLIISAEQLAQAYLKSININQGLSQFISIIADVISIASITLVLTLSTFSQIKDIGIFRTLGMKRKDIVVEKLIEALYGGLIGSLIGTGMSILFGGYIHVFSSAFSYTPIYSPKELVELFSLGVITALLGSIYPIVWIIKLTPVETIRRGEM
ncbi:FtsX-like permease family protein [Sulfolobus sp. S-194]|uniref:ABC transporter permease n=1 Tax=Sulfolobus sp. S-194 TaxID=2512240 RepID=UPI001437338B|nr:FtsX-like permease family protein [Sulfolobus sp. S-194]QIW23193.1 FtsX-like permease family protein [Sulfolobus sp. S-194]